MEEKNSSEESQTELPTCETLIRSEWATIKELKRLLHDPDTSVKEKANVSKVLGFHVNTLNNLLIRKGNREEFNEQNLGDYVRCVEPQMARRLRRDFRVWKRALSRRRY